MLNLISNSYENIDTSKYEFLNNKTIVLTGASGLIGLNLLALFNHLKKTYNINIICTVNNPVSEYLQPLFDNCITVVGDLTDGSVIGFIENYFVERLNGADIVIHSAGYAQPNKFLDDKLSTIKLNTCTIMSLFRLLNKGGVFFYCSSSELYSGLEKESISENEIGLTSTDHPRSCYIESKRCGEAICLSATDTFNIKIGRISTTYGPGCKLSDSRVINDLIKKAIYDNNIKLLDDGLATRTLCYISDMCQMMLDVICSGSKNIYNLTGKEKISIKNIAEIISRHTNSSIEYGDKNNAIIGNPKNVSISINRYEEEFGSKKFINIEEGILSTIKWYQFLKDQ